MNGKTFVDTNIVVYAHDRTSGEKYKIAKEIFEKLWAEVLLTEDLQNGQVIDSVKIVNPFE